MTFTKQQRDLTTEDFVHIHRFCSLPGTVHILPCSRYVDLLYLTKPSSRSGFFVGQSVLYKHVNAIAAGIDVSSPEKAKYTAVAEQFRIPYWDWARADVAHFPVEALNEPYSRQGPESSNSVKPKFNPLYQFKFESGVPDDIKV